MANVLDFQSMILNLQDYWSKWGCLIWQPYYSQVGAGTMNPATYLRVLGPEPWNVAYVEPSVRPDDGRYGENPNRFQQHTQFQVILKPDPGNPQEIYLKSLEALGIDPRQHDIRFVEDNWESPALGAWGLGWEVWLDGQEITQFTYFQQAGGQVLDPVSVEITYGLERIAMVLQNARHFKDLAWNNQRTVGDLMLQGEQEHSRYYFELADVERIRQMYDLFEAEAKNALSHGLVLPAHDYILKCSHTFNILDSRGVIGVTERQAYFGRMRNLARQVAEEYLKQRQELEYPWLPDNEGETSRSENPVTAKAQKNPVDNHSPADFLLEIGTEELPAADLDAALAYLNTSVEGMLKSLRLAHGEVCILGTPRRLVTWVKELAPRQPDKEEVVKGPPAERAFDPEGKPTKAAEGFARSRGVPVSEIAIREMDGGSYASLLVKEKGKPSVEVLPEALTGLVGGLKFDKSMRWNSSNVSFSRPIRWLLTLYGNQVVPFSYAGLTSGRVTRGLRFHDPEQFELAKTGDYWAVLRGQGILVDPKERRTAIQKQVQELLKGSGAAETLAEDLLDEVANLVEAPTAFLGRFDSSHLSLPAEVLVSVMKKHQRYFPAVRTDGSLVNAFVGVRNGDVRGLEVVRDGNEQVILARFADASFFIREDVKQSLEDFVPHLGSLTFQNKLGSMLDKTRRIQKLVDGFIPMVGMDEGEALTTRRAAALCKADLASKMVVEMTSLQGIMGKTYALRSGESEAVAQAIFEHYMPRNMGDKSPASQPGLVVGLADRLDSLAGLFAAGLAPTGTRDPFAQRRTALGLVQALVDWDLDFDLRRGLEMASANLPITSSSQVQLECLEFIAGRLRSSLLENGYRYDVVDAILAAQQHNPAGVMRGVKELSQRVADPMWPKIQPAYARCVRILRSASGDHKMDPALPVEGEEKTLQQLVKEAGSMNRGPGCVEDFFTAFTPLVPAIDRFFEAVLVMDEDARARENRLGLLQRIAALADGVADFSLLEGF